MITTSSPSASARQDSERRSRQPNSASGWRSSEKQRCVGGACLETGTIPSKTFREAVRALTGRSNLDASDSPARVRPTMQQLLNRVSAVIQRETDVVQDQLARNDVDLLRGKASFQGPHTVLNPYKVAAFNAANKLQYA